MKATHITSDEIDALRETIELAMMAYDEDDEEETQ